MSKPAFFTQPLIHVTGHQGSLSLFLAALVYHAVNPGTTAPTPNRYDHSWFGAESLPGGYYHHWMSLCHVMDQYPNDPVEAAYNASLDWTSTGKHHVIESTRPEPDMHQLFGEHRHIMLYSYNEDRYQLAHNYITLDCIARGWNGFEGMIADWNSAQPTPMSDQELHELFTDPHHLDHAVTREIIRHLGNKMYVDIFEPDEVAITGALNLFYPDYADPAKAQQTIDQITSYLGDLVVADPKELTKALIGFLNTRPRLDYDSFLL